jgi:hypothetical protein
MPNKARCFAKVHTGPKTARKRATPDVVPSGYWPSDLQSAYNLPSSTAGSGETVAVVDAFNNPTAEQDLQTYRSQFGLPACTTANGCFRKVDQRGGTSYPPTDTGWAGEIALDIDMVSAICPKCHILLVEADDDIGDNLLAAEDEAANLGANAIGNSWGVNESDIGNTEPSLESFFDHPGIAITASSGDNGYGDVEYPAASQFVTAVGGTSLSKSGSSWSETVWSDTSSGCSAFISKPPWQSDPGCSNRTVVDAAAVADPQTGVAVYDSNNHGWLQAGGTSVSAQIIAAVYALAGNTSSINNGSFPYSNPSSLFDVTSGSNGNCATSATTSDGGGETTDTTSKGVVHQSNASPALAMVDPTKVDKIIKRIFREEGLYKGNAKSKKDKNHKKKHSHQKQHSTHHQPKSPPSSGGTPPPSSGDAYLCTGVPGYDGPTGNGTPNGTGAF